MTLFSDVFGSRVSWEYELICWIYRFGISVVCCWCLLWPLRTDSWSPSSNVHRLTGARLTDRHWKQMRIPNRLISGGVVCAFINENILQLCESNGTGKPTRNRWTVTCLVHPDRCFVILCSGLKSASSRHWCFDRSEWRTLNKCAFISSGHVFTESYSGLVWRCLWRLLWCSHHRHELLIHRWTGFLCDHPQTQTRSTVRINTKFWKITGSSLKR